MLGLRACCRLVLGLRFCLRWDPSISTIEGPSAQWIAFLVGPSVPEVDRIVPTTDATLWVDRGPGRGSEVEPRRHCGAIRI